MSPEHLLIAFGVLLLLIGIVGGGFEVKELRIPKVGTAPRTLSLAIGFVLVFMGAGIGVDAPGDAGNAVAPDELPGVISAYTPAGPQSSPATPVPQPALTTPAASGLRRIEAVQPQQTEELDEYSVVILNQLQETSSALAVEGFTLFDVASGSLPASGSEAFEMDLGDGWEYVFAGACDQDCTDIDLEVSASDGIVIGSDYEADDRPVVRVTPGAGRFVITSKVYSCSTATCYYGIGVYRR